MLILSRRHNETIRIGEDVSVTVLEIRHGQVKLGVSAPKEVRVDRQEVRERMGAERA